MSNKKLINEAFKISKAKDGKGNPIAFIDPKIPENSKTFNYREIFKDHGAQWSASPRFRNVFPKHTSRDGFWFWYVGKTKDKWREIFDKMIKPALEKVHGAEGADEGQSKGAIIHSLDAIIEKIKTSPPKFDDNTIVTKDQTEAIADKLEEFKRRLVNISSDEEFKETMKKIIARRRQMGYAYSFFNMIMIMVQRPKAVMIKSKTDWFNYYNRKVNTGAEPILLSRPAGVQKNNLSKDRRKEIINDFVKKAGGNIYSDLTAGEKERLNKQLNAGYANAGFTFYPSYAFEDTTLIEGKDDPAMEFIKSREDIKWTEEDVLDEKVKPIYDALMSFAEQKGLKVSKVSADTLGTSKGVSKSGSIEVLDNEGDDVGLTKTLAHEVAHEILHQTYLKSKDNELKDYFIGKEEGRGVVEQQAEITAWMVMAAFGFDLQTTSLNYAVIWGADDKNMIKVFDAVSRVSNYLIKVINDSGVDLVENVDIPLNKQNYTPMDVAKILGVEKEFIDVERGQQQINEMVTKFNKLIR